MGERIRVEVGQAKNMEQQLDACPHTQCVKVQDGLTQQVMRQVAVACNAQVSQKPSAFELYHRCSQPGL